MVKVTYKQSGRTEQRSSSTESKGDRLTRLKVLDECGFAHKPTQGLYVSNVLRARAQALSDQTGCGFDEAWKMVLQSRNKSNKIINKRKKTKSRPQQKKLARRLGKQRNASLREFSVKVSKGARSVQGGAPGLGKRK